MNICQYNKLTAKIKKKFYKVSKFCAMCSPIETTTHVFCDCVLTTPVWRWVSSVINRLFSNPVALTPQLILLCHGLPRGKQHRQPNRIAAFLIKLTLNELWAARNQYTFENTRPTSQGVINKIKSRARFRVKAAFDFTVAPDFIKSWAYKDVLCSVAQGTLHIHI